MSNKIELQFCKDQHPGPGTAASEGLLFRRGGLGPATAPSNCWNFLSTLRVAGDDVPGCGARGTGHGSGRRGAAGYDCEAAFDSVRLSGTARDSTESRPGRAGVGDRHWAWALRAWPKHGANTSLRQRPSLPLGPPAGPTPTWRRLKIAVRKSAGRSDRSE